MTKRVAVIYPEAETGAVERFRRRWDPMGAVVAAHVTIAFPFEGERDVDEMRAVLTEAMPKPFPVRLAAPTIWDDEYLFLMAERGGAHIARLHDAVYNSLGLARSERFVPHMTVGRRVPGPDQDKMVRAATGLSVTGWARSLSIYRLAPDGRMTPELTIN